MPVIGCDRSFTGKMPGDIRVELRGRIKVPEVADKLGVTINTVKTQVRFGYKKVRSDLNLPGATLFMLLSMLLK